MRRFRNAAAVLGDRTRRRADSRASGVIFARPHTSGVKRDFETDNLVISCLEILAAHLIQYLLHNSSMVTAGVITDFKTNKDPLQFLKYLLSEGVSAVHPHTVRAKQRCQPFAQSKDAKPPEAPPRGVSLGGLKGMTSPNFYFPRYHKQISVDLSGPVVVGKNSPQRSFLAGWLSALAEQTPERLRARRAPRVRRRRQRPWRAKAQHPVFARRPAPRFFR
jgi:hypothetical protein